MKIHKVFYPFTILQIPQIEKFIQQKSLEGYKLVSIKHGWLTFIKSPPKEREYFIYISPVFEKPDRFMSVFFAAKHQYAIRKTQIDKSESLYFEIDLKKKDLWYRSLCIARRKHYIKYYFKILAISTVYTTILFIMTLFEHGIYPLAFLGVVLIIFSLFSICVLGFSKITK